MEPGFQIYGPHKAEAASPIEHMNDLVTALLIAALFIALGGGQIRALLDRQLLTVGLVAAVGFYGGAGDSSWS